MAPSDLIELVPPDISAYRAGNTGIPYVTTFDSGKPGPHVLLTAVVHGNELCGAITLDFLFRENVRPKRGRMTLAFCNVAAYLQFNPDNPTASRFVDEDFNRVWSPDRLDGTQRSAELARARELRPLVDSADFLLDIHSMQQATAPLMMCGPLEKGRRFARAVGIPEIIVSDEGHAAGRRMRDYGGFGDPASAKNALLVECGQHWEASSAVVAKETALHFLATVDVIGADVIERFKLSPKPNQQKLIEVTDAVTIAAEKFTFAGNFVGLEVIPKRGMEIGRDGQTPVVAPYDNCVLIMPSRRLSRGQTAVRLGRYIG
ncbi:MAG TPA: M14 family metallopeptidase [Alphaproteobacteria bacterium]|nr:M14 family metallopeptidase [Alphaproteobacteria bacterium]